LPADWENREYCALDVETTGLDPFKDRVVEIGLVVFGFDRDSALVEKDAWSTLVNPEMAIPDAAYAIHGISDLDVSGSPHFAEIVGKVADYVHNRIFVAHNAPFDAAFLGNEFARLSAPSPVGDLVDTLTLARAAYPNLFSYNLGKTAYLLGIPPGQGHRALDDAKTCMQLFVRCIRTLSVFQNQ
jgi:DNA polymerase-3 subunit epsilon/DNA polymerase-3 subunit alpha (Gram-positive type)